MINIPAQLILTDARTWPRTRLERLRQELGTQQRRYIDRYSRDQDRLAHLIAREIAVLALQSCPDFSQAQPGDLRHAPTGRLYSTRAAECSINPSYSWPWVMVAIHPSDPQIGVDIEQAEPGTWAEVVNAFSPETRNRILGDQCPEIAFYRTWSAYESVIKAMGLGMRIAPHELQINLDTRRATFLDHSWTICFPTTGIPNLFCSLASRTPGHWDLHRVSPNDHHIPITNRQDVEYAAG